MLAYTAPTSVEEAVRALAGASGTAKVLSGGTDLLVQLRSGRLKADLIVDTKKIPGIAGIREEGGGFVIGAATSGAQIGEHERLGEAWPGVVEAANLIGSTQIQGRASLAGNLCNASPAADGTPVLMALAASVVLRSERGERTVPVEQFVVGNRRTVRASDELLVAVRVPARGAGARSVFIKLGGRRYLTISMTMVAVVLDVDRTGAIAYAGVAVGSCAAMARRLPRLEARLLGVSAASDLGARVEPADLAPLRPIDDLRASADYRRDATATLLRRALHGAAAS
jgi:carbon-monoxide dehydrogenase medium subunit